MTIPFSNIKKRWMKNPKFRKAYDALEEEFQLAQAMIEARSRAGLTQDEIAKRMGTSQSAVARMEGGALPSMKSLLKYAHATGSKLHIEMVDARG